MGGWGSGRRSNSKKITSDYQQFDIREWQRRGLLVPFGGRGFVAPQRNAAAEWRFCMPAIPLLVVAATISLRRKPISARIRLPIDGA